MIRQILKFNKNHIDITGQKFNILTAISFSHLNKFKHHCWLFKCDCGKEKIISKAKVTIGHTKSCGCRKNKDKIRHGYTGTKTYKSWKLMIARCRNLKSNDKYKNYAGRGIGVCDRWRESFVNFLEDMGERPKDKTLDRVNNNGNYEPNNCRWATQREQMNNVRYNINISFQNKTKTLSEWCRLLRLNYDMAYNRFKRGLSFEKIVKELRN